MLKRRNNNEVIQKIGVKGRVRLKNKYMEVIRDREEGRGKIRVIRLVGLM